MVIASEIYAAAHGQICKGPVECHWCAGPCERTYVHDDVPLYIGVKRSCAKRPGNSYICVGCYLWRRTGMSVRFLDGSYKDRQTPSNHSWLVTMSDCKGIRMEMIKLEAPLLYPILLNPPCHFFLSLCDPKVSNQLALCEANWLPSVTPETPLKFTYNGVVNIYTTKELEIALDSEKEVNGISGGTRQLVKLLGPFDRGVTKKERGRPTIEAREAKSQKRILRVSGG